MSMIAVSDVQGFTTVPSNYYTMYGIYCAEVGTSQPIAVVIKDADGIL
jgi:hypothetical protein